MAAVTTNNLDQPASPAEPLLPAHLADVTSNEATLRRFLFGLPGVDPVGIEQRAAALATRSIKKAPSSPRSTWRSRWST